MQISLHARQRMSQRGITREIVDMVLEHGEVCQGKAVLGQKEAKALLNKLQREMRVLKKILDKGGVIVVEENDTVITTYNYNQ